jgi:hypothetical protein
MNKSARKLLPDFKTNNDLFTGTAEQLLNSNVQLVKAAIEINVFLSISSKICEKNRVSTSRNITQQKNMQH